MLARRRGLRPRRQSDHLRLRRGGSFSIRRLHMTQSTNHASALHECLKRLLLPGITLNGLLIVSMQHMTPGKAISDIPEHSLCRVVTLLRYL